MELKYLLESHSQGRAFLPRRKKAFLTPKCMTDASSMGRNTEQRKANLISKHTKDTDMEEQPEKDGVTLYYITSNHSGQWMQGGDRHWWVNVQ